MPAPPIVSTPRTEAPRLGVMPVVFPPGIRGLSAARFPAWRDAMRRRGENLSRFRICAPRDEWSGRTVAIARGASFPATGKERLVRRCNGFFAESRDSFVKPEGSIYSRAAAPRVAILHPGGFPPFRGRIWSGHRETPLYGRRVQPWGASCVHLQPPIRLSARHCGPRGSKSAPHLGGGRRRFPEWLRFSMEAPHSRGGFGRASPCDRAAAGLNVPCGRGGIARVASAWPREPFSLVSRRALLPFPNGKSPFPRESPRRFHLAGAVPSQGVTLKTEGRVLFKDRDQRMAERAVGPSAGWSSLRSERRLPGLPEIGGAAQAWARKFGLADVPLFERNEVVRPEDHRVLLDGSFGSFAMSETEDPIWEDPRTVSWAWSCNLPHHVTVGSRVVAVRRWDSSRPKILPRDMVELRMEEFYEYLNRDRVHTTPRVVDHVLRLFNRVQALAAKKGIPDERGIEVFLAFLDMLIEREKESDEDLKFPVENELLRMFARDELNALAREFDMSSQKRTFQFFPSLAVRHAGGAIFQEILFALTRNSPSVLLEESKFRQAGMVARSGVHFTPETFARGIVENAFAEIQDLMVRKNLTVLDPACGAGSFLKETVRTLRRLGYSGRLRLIGRDISSAAVAMARFVVDHSVSDWSPEQGVDIDIDTADFLVDSPEPVDVVLMNPPFISWGTMDEFQRSRTREILGSDQSGSVDLSMAFITRGMEILDDGGVLGSLLPASLLTARSAKQWRDGIVEKGNLGLLASFGDIGFFAHTSAEVAAVVVSKTGYSRPTSENVRTVLCANNVGEPESALRMLRKIDPDERANSEDHGWWICSIPRDRLKTRPTWHLESPEVEAALAGLREAKTPTISELFEIHRGVVGGRSDVFLLDQKQFNGLPERERRYFRGAAMNDSIQGGTIKDSYLIFHPYENSELTITDEKHLRRSLPTYFGKYLEAARDNLDLAGRKEIHDRWWDPFLVAPHWITARGPRIISRASGGPGSFAADVSAEFVPVQGLGWIPARRAVMDQGDDSEFPSPADLVCGYSALMNSNYFLKILEIYSPCVTGGNIDLNPKYVGDVLMPDLLELARDRGLGRGIARLINFGREPRLSDPGWIKAVDRIAGNLYGFDFFEED